MAKQPTKTEMTTEIASIARDYRVPTYGGIMRPDDDTLMSRGGGKGLRIYDDLERDCHCYAVLQKRKHAVVAGEWEVDAASERPIDVRAADVVRAQIEAVPFDRICVELLDAVLKGYAVSAAIWEPRGNEIVVSNILARDQGRFVFDTTGRPRLLTLQNMVEGEELPNRKFIVHRFGGKSGNPYGLGLGTRLFWPVFFKRQGITFWLTFADKFGNPTAVGKYPNGAEVRDQKKLLDALQALAHDTGVIIPEGMIIELLEAQRSGNVNTHEQLARYMDEQMSEAVLGETLTTNIGKSGSYAASNTHNEVREELRDADADMLSDTLNGTLVKWITELNVPGATPPKLWRNYEEPEDLNTKADRDEKIHKMGFDPSDQYIRETYGEGWVRRKTQIAPAAAPPNGQDEDQDDAPPPETPAFAEEDQDLVDELTRQLDEAAGPALDLVIERIRKRLGAAEDLAAFSESLPDLFHAIGDDGLADAIRRGLVVADLQGRADIEDGPGAEGDG